MAKWGYKFSFTSRCCCIFLPFECCNNQGLFCFVLSPTWIIRISISCTSERKTKKTNKHRVYKPENCKEFFVSYGERIFGGAMSFAYRESASEGDDGKRSLSGKTQNGWTASPGSFCVRVRGNAQRRGWWHSWNLVASLGPHMFQECPATVVRLYPLTTKAGWWIEQGIFPLCKNAKAGMPVQYNKQYFCCTACCTVLWPRGTTKTALAARQ